MANLGAHEDLTVDILREFTYRHHWSLFFDDGLLWYRNPNNADCHIKCIKLDKRGNRQWQFLETRMGEPWQDAIARWSKQLTKANEGLMDSE